MRVEFSAVSVPYGCAGISRYLVQHIRYRNCTAISRGLCCTDEHCCALHAWQTLALLVLGATLSFNTVFYCIDTITTVVVLLSSFQFLTFTSKTKLLQTWVDA